MADMQAVNIPKPPSTPDLNELNKWAMSLSIFLEQNMSNGLQTTFLSNNQLSDVTDKQHTGKLFYNNDDNTLHASVIESGNVVMKKITLT